MDQRITSSNQETSRPRFHERLYASWWTWPLPLAIAVLLAAEVHMGYPGVRAWLPYLVLVPVAVAIVLWLGRTKVSVQDGELWVSDAHLPLRCIEDAEQVPVAEKRRALGPDLDPAAFVVHRPWVRTMVRVWLDDPEDPTPYWMITSRHPEQLVAALRPEQTDPGTADAAEDATDDRGPEAATAVTNSGTDERSHQDAEHVNE